MFTIYIAAILKLGSFIPCSYGGVLEKLGWTKHLIFNGVFVLMFLLAIVLYKKQVEPVQPTKRTTAVIVSGSFISSTVVMVGLIFFSGVLRDKRGSFLRVFPSHPVLEDMVLDVRYNSYYLAGGTARHIYLGNYSSPLRMQVLNATDTTTQVVKLDIEGIMDQKSSPVRIAVDSPYFYAYDGAVPRIYKGTVDIGTPSDFLEC